MSQNPQQTADLVTFNEEILNEKLHILCSDIYSSLFLILQKVFRRHHWDLHNILLRQYKAKRKKFVLSFIFSWPFFDFEVV